jgi:hypothetical protein
MLTNSDLWVASLGIGGEILLSDVREIISGSRPAAPLEHDILASALNDHFTGRGEDRPVAMWRDLPGGLQRSSSPER